MTWQALNKEAWPNPFSDSYFLVPVRGDRCIFTNLVCLHRKVCMARGRSSLFASASLAAAVEPLTLPPLRPPPLVFSRFEDELPDVVGAANILTSAKKQEKSFSPLIFITIFSLKRLFFCKRECIGYATSLGF